MNNEQVKTEKKGIGKLPLPAIIAVIAAVVVIAVAIPVLVLLFGKQVPVYEGMTVLNSYNGSTAEGLLPIKQEYRYNFLSNENGNNGNHYGNNKKPADEVMEGDDSIGIEIPEQPMFYSSPNKDVYIKIHISNPDSFEILSFTLNGQKYSSYMFEDGSDMENLILKVNVGSEPGIREYTIDAIKYVDGTDIKDVDMRGERTVKVGIYSSNIQPTASVSNVVTELNDIAFNVSVTDTYKLISRSEGKLYAAVLSADAVVAYQEISVGDNSVKLEGLDTNTAYRYVIAACYDALDGNAFDTHVLIEQDFTTQSYVSASGVAADQESISFGLIFSELLESKTVEAMTLYLGDEKVVEFEVAGDVSKKNFKAEGLLSGKEYKLIIAYKNKGVDESVTVYITTEAKTAPDFELTEADKTQTGVSFDVAITDVDAVGAISKIELMQGEDVVKTAADMTQREFTELRSNNTYTVKVTYTYDLNDGVGEHTIEKTLDVKTEAKAEPTFAFKDVTSTTYAISGSYDQTNADSTLISYVVELYKGDELVKESADQKIAFDSLDHYTEYTVRITYTFDVNDGNGVQTKTVERTLKTAPFINVTSATIIDKKDVYFDGDSATVRINVENPLAAKAVSVIIDGKTYEASDSSTSKIILVDIEDVGTLGSATVEGVVVSIDGTEYTVENITQTPIDILIIGKMTITSWEFVNESFERIEYASVSDKVYLVFSANKMLGNTITNITLNHGESYRHYWNGGNDPAPSFTQQYTANEIKMLDDGRFYVELKNKSAKGYHFNDVTVTYKSEYVDTATADVKEFLQHPFVLLNSTDVRYVSTPQEFMDMEDGYLYELTCDLDFSAIGNWQNRGFKGVLDGKGYAIQNLLIMAGNGSFDPDGDIVNSGVFTYLEGIIQNLNFESFTYMEKSADGAFYGTGVVGYALRSSIIRNCSIDEYSEIVTTRTYYHTGAICGINEGIIEGCTSYATIESNAANVGGICGASFADIKNCTNYGSLTNKHGVGGICGNTYLDYVTVENCNNYGDINSTYGSIGGIIASTNYNTIVKNCNNYGDINSNYGSIGGIIAPTYYNTIIVNNCNNYGNITVGDGFDDLSSAYAIGGSVMQNCSNYGTIKVITSCPEVYDDDRIANMFEQFDENDVNCYNYGAIYFNDTVIKEATSTPEE